MRRLKSETIKYLPGIDAFTTQYDYTVSSSGATRKLTYPGGRQVLETYDKRLRQVDIDGDAAGSQAVGTTSCRRDADAPHDDANRRTGHVRANGIPVTRHPDQVEPTVDRDGKPTRGRTYRWYDSIRRKWITIREDAAGHVYPDDPSQNRGPHFNDECKRHYDYDS